MNGWMDNLVVGIHITNWNNIRITVISIKGQRSNNQNNPVHTAFLYSFDNMLCMQSFGHVLTVRRFPVSDIRETATARPSDKCRTQVRRRWTAEIAMRHEMTK